MALFRATTQTLDLQVKLLVTELLHNVLIQIWLKLHFQSKPASFLFKFSFEPSVYNRQTQKVDLHSLCVCVFVCVCVCVWGGGGGCRCTHRTPSPWRLTDLNKQMSYITDLDNNHTQHTKIKVIEISEKEGMAGRWFDNNFKHLLHMLVSVSLTPRSDEYVTSPYNNNTLSSRQVKRIDKLISQRVSSWYKFS